MFALRRALPAARQFSTSSARSSFAKMTIVGRLADQPEIQATSTGREILKYVVAADSGYGENKKGSFFRVTAFTNEGPLRDFIAGLEKGTMVYLEGEASYSTYQDAEGKNKYTLNIVQRQLEVLSSKKQPQQ